MDKMTEFVAAPNRKANRLSGTELQDLVQTLADHRDADLVHQGKAGVTFTALPSVVENLKSTFGDRLIIEENKSFSPLG